MKFLVKIYAIYILILPCITCTDAKDYADTLKISASSGHHHEEEACSPFCNCVCCGHVVSSNIITNEITVTDFLLPKKQNSFYNSISLSSDFYGNIWQPPKIG